MPVKRINTPQQVATTAKPGCLARVGKWGIGAFLVLVGCGVVANLAPRTPATLPAATATPQPVVRSAAVAIDPSPTATATPPPPTATIAPTMTAIRPAATDTATIAPTATATRPAATNTATVAPTATPTRPAATATSTPAPSGPVANNNANLREGPGTEYPVVGGATAGQPLALVGQNSAGDWLQLDSGAWIAAALVAGVPAGLPVVEAPAAVAASPTTSAATQPTAASPPAEQPNAFTCIGGCATPPNPSCAIKGNVNSKGEKIYHMPGWRDYDRTDIKPEEGDVWFCTAEEATTAGFRAPLNH